MSTNSPLLMNGHLMTLQSYDRFPPKASYDQFQSYSLCSAPVVAHPYNWPQGFCSTPLLISIPIQAFGWVPTQPLNHPREHKTKQEKLPACVEGAVTVYRLRCASHSATQRLVGASLLLSHIQGPAAPNLPFCFL